ncbi:M14 family zinc carboxypeptidase [Alicyclobacillus macrosporangiidus]|uniref:Zinc carboxypeptidase n=1 Tax=Alicyclobacillus macrosporangiidus TaxID=392015 RepID=A0A1I7KYS8_9BACL|nr:M14 family zinc carboxypeptidase [Alicyclobacillus macrosporangiidus]SFV02444.1 Zinc carboxypeptidase [Alicyclobacillus macrosporangiidus]
MKRNSVRSAVWLSALATTALCTWGNPQDVGASSLSFETKKITLNGQLISAPKGFVYNNTTYLPIWYLMQALNRLGIASTWDGSNWNLTVNEAADYTNPNTSSSGKAIIVNGFVVEHAPALIEKDPSSGVETTYMPIWYLQQALNRLGIHSAWDGTTWAMTASHPIPPLPGIALTTRSITTDNGYRDAQVASFYDGTEYMDLDAVTKALAAFGVPNVRSGNDWYWNQSAAPGDATVAFDPATPMTVHLPDQSEIRFPVVAFQGKTYVPIWYVMTGLKRLGDYPTWNGQVFLIAKLPPAHPVVNPNQTYSYTIMQSDIQSLKDMYPDLIQVKVVGQTAYGRDIYAVGLGKGKATVLISGSHHAREWITTALNMYMLDRYAYAYRNNQWIGGYNVKQILDETTIWFIPMVNPDGVTLAQFGDSVFPADVRASLVAMNNGSTNFARWKNNAQGIDPNRQYDGGWYTLPSIVTHPWYEFYKGTAPYQINEVKAVLNLINQINPQEEVAYHASGGVIYWGYQIRPDNLSHFHDLALRMSRLTGYPVQTPPANEQGGGLTDWWTQKVGRPGFTIEVGPAVGEAPVPIQYFSSIWSQNQAVGLELAEEGYNQYVQNPDSVVHAP